MPKVLQTQNKKFLKLLYMIEEITKTLISKYKINRKGKPIKYNCFK